jgi:hypothetical protein
MVAQSVGAVKQGPPGGQRERKPEMIEDKSMQYCTSPNVASQTCFWAPKSNGFEQLPAVAGQSAKETLTAAL